MALVLADAVLEKFGGDSLIEVQRNLANYLEAMPQAVATDPEIVDPAAVATEVDDSPMGDSLSEWRV